MIKRDLQIYLRKMWCVDLAMSIGELKAEILYKILLYNKFALQ